MIHQYHCAPAEGGYLVAPSGAGEALAGALIGAADHGGVDISVGVHLGRAEDAVVDCICNDAVDAGIDKLTAEYIKTQKNVLVADFWPRMNFTQTDANENQTHHTLDLTSYTPKTFEYLTFE